MSSSGIAMVWISPGINNTGTSSPTCFAAIWAAIGMAYYARLARTSTLEVLKQDYIRTARSKGLKEPIVVRRHVIRNALIPLVTAFGVALGFLVGGAFFIETIFNIPGIGFTT